MINVYSIVTLVAGIISFLIGQLVFFKNPRSRVNIIFFIFCLLVAYLHFTNFSRLISGSYEQADFWIKVSLGWIISPAVFLHFLLYFTEKNKLLKKAVVLTGLYLPGILFLVINFWTKGGLAGNPTVFDWGWDYMTDKKYDLINNLWAIWAMLLIILGLLITVKFYRSTQNMAKKVQSKYVIIGFFVSFVFSFYNIGLFTFGIVFPDINNIGTTIHCLLIGYAIINHDLLVINPVAAADKIVSTMNDCLILLDSNKKITVVNRSLLTLLKYREEDLISKDISTILSTNNNSIFFQKTQYKKGEMKDYEISLITNQNEKIPVSVSFTPLLTRSRIVQGYICIARDIRERMKSRKELQETAIRLENQNEELERLNNVLTGRELKMIELKKEIERLKQVCGKNTPENSSVKS